jgi:hypothetical protein
MFIFPCWQRSYRECLYSHYFKTQYSINIHFPPPRIDGKHKRGLQVCNSVTPDEGPSRETSKFSLYFSGIVASLYIPTKAFNSSSFHKRRTSHELMLFTDPNFNSYSYLVSIALIRTQIPAKI